MKLYLIGSLRNPAIPSIAVSLRNVGIDVFDDWHAAGPEADDEWQRYEKERGRPFEEAIRGEHARAVVDLDRKHLDASEAALLIMPAGKSAFLELGYIIGQDKPGFILLHPDYDRWDVMFKFATDIFTDVDRAVKSLGAIQERLDEALLAADLVEDWA